MMERKRVYRISRTALALMLTEGWQYTARRGLPAGAAITAIQSSSDGESMLLVCEHESFEPIDTTKTCYTHDFAISRTEQPANVQVFSVQ